MKRIVILQPGYIPWLGFFEQMSKCDIFVFLDDVQYTKNDWRNRNRIKTKEGIQWLSIPVSFKFGQKINEVQIDNTQPWSNKHIQSLRSWYGKSNYYKEYITEIEEILKKKWTHLVDLDIELIKWIIAKLGLQIEIYSSSNLSISNKDKQIRLIEICKYLNCNLFYEGKSGKDYINPKLFENHGITIEFQEYTHPYYNQLWTKEINFISHLSVIDLLFNHGSNSLSILNNKKIIQIPEGMIVRQADDL